MLLNSKNKLFNLKIGKKVEIKFNKNKNYWVIKN